MPGVNLSQPITEKQVQEKKKGEGGRMIVAGLFVLVLLVWGGIQGGIAWYDKQITLATQQVEEKKSSLTGGDVDMVADVEARLYLVNQAKKQQTPAQDVLMALEALMIPENHLTSFQYDVQKGSVLIVGVAPGYKEVSRQVMALKTSKNFSNLQIESLAHEKSATGATGPDQKVTFGFRMVWSK